MIRLFSWTAAVAGVAGAACSFAPQTPEAPAGPAASSAPREVQEPTAAQGPRPTRNSGLSVTRLYQENCVNCHGDRGQGGGAGTPSLLTREKFDQRYDRPFFLAIHNGVPDRAMPAYAESLTDEEIWGLVVHIRELQARALREKEGDPRPDANGVYASQRGKFRIETAVEEGKGLRVPWAVDWLPDGRMLVTNRGGELFIAKDSELTSVQGVPESTEIGQGGLMEVAVHPNYAQNGWIYLALTDPAPGDRRRGQTKIVRGKLDGNRWTGTQTIFQAPAESYTGAGVHFGSRIVFDGKGNLFFSIGERARMDPARDPKDPNGKIYRVKEDGGKPAGNPFAGQGGVSDYVWSVGHRNPQGLVLDLQGNLWDTEHGPRGGDELNLVQRGKDYGWPTYALSINYNDQPFRTPWPKNEDEIVQPVFRWLPSIGACGLDVARGAAFPVWRGDLLAAGLAGQNLDRIRVKDGKLVEREELLHGLGRIRDVSVGPDGAVYVTLNDPDKIVRLVPAG